MRSTDIRSTRGLPAGTLALGLSLALLLGVTQIRAAPGPVTEASPPGGGELRPGG